MNIYISHARKDTRLALQLAQRLQGEGLTLVHPEMEIGPGDNWAMKIGHALQQSEFMVFLMTPGAFEADWLRLDIDYALGAQKFDGRVYTVFVGPAAETRHEVPWILLKQPHRQVDSPRAFGKVAKEIAAQCSAPETSSAHA